MTEQEYIDATDLQKLKSAILILRDITPPNSKVLPSDKFGVVVETLQEWRDELYKQVEIV